MTTVYPASEDSFDRPTASSSLSGHAALHDDLADAIEAIENKVGVDNSTDVTSIDYKLAHLGDTYYTETEVDAALATKLNSSAYTANDVLTKIKTVDGAGSGLDADLLDGNQASAFSLAHSHPYASSSHDHNTVYADINHGHTNMLTGKRGNGSYYVDGNGYATITHGLGSTPVAAFVQTRAQITTGGGGGETVISLPVTSVTSTTVTFRAYEADAGNNNNSGYVSTIFDTTPGDTYVNVSWLVIA